MSLWQMPEYLISIATISGPKGLVGNSPFSNGAPGAAVKIDFALCISAPLVSLSKTPVRDA
jgi:hypothetical protein